MTTLENEGKASSYGSGRPISDPSVATIDMLANERLSQREWILQSFKTRDVRVDAIEAAQQKFEEGLEAFPTEFDRAIKSFREVLDKQFETVAVERQASEKAVATALASAKELSTLQRLADATAIDKADKATEKLLDSMRAETSSSISRLESKFDDMKERLTNIEGMKQGSTEQRTDTRNNQSQMIAFAGFAIAAAVAFASVITAVAPSSGSGPMSRGPEGVTIQSSGGGRPDAQLQVRPGQ